MAGSYSIKKAALINAGGKYLKVILSLVVNAILARILTPEDYGIVAVITVFSTFFTTFSDMGFGTAIIQKKELTDDDIRSIYSFTVYVSFALMFIFTVLVYPIAKFYGDMVYIPLGLMLSVSLLFNALNMVPNGILNRQKKFVSIAVRTVVVYSASAIITIILALIGWKYYALATQAVLSSLFTFLWNYATTKPGFLFRYEKSSILKILDYSGYQFAFNVVNYFSRNLDNLLTGKFMGNVELGYYNKAYTLMLYPVNNLANVVAPVLHPLLSDYQRDLAVIYRKYIKVMKLLACIAVFVSPFCYFAAEEIIWIMYGPNWLSSVECFRIMSVVIITQIMNSSAGGVFQSIGSTKLLFINGCINSGITVLAILIGVFWGGNIVFLSQCIAVAYIFHFLTAFGMLIKLGFHYSMFAFLKDLMPEMLIAGVLVLATVVYPFDIGDMIVSAVLKFLYLCVIYIVLLFVTKEIRIFGVLRKRK